MTRVNSWMAASFVMSLSACMPSAYAQTSSAPSASIHATNQLYHCAREILRLDQALTPAGRGTKGQLILAGPLVLYSLLANDSSEILLIASASGLYQVPLPHEGLNRIRFRLPNVDQSNSEQYFVTYAHGTWAPFGEQRSRLYQFSLDRPEFPREELDFEPVPVTPASHLLAHFEYAMAEAVGQRTLSAVRLESLSRKEGPTRSIFRNWQSAQAQCDSAKVVSHRLAKELYLHKIAMEKFVVPVVTNTKRAPASASIHIRLYGP